MKKIISLALTLVLLVAFLSGCNTNQADYTVGVCQLMVHDSLDKATQGFQDALIAELGEGNVSFDLQNAAGDTNTCATIVNSFVSNDVDLIMANATPALQAAVAATADIIGIRYKKLFVEAAPIWLKDTFQSQRLAPLAISPR